MNKQDMRMRRRLRVRDCMADVLEYLADEEVELDARIADLCRNRNRQSSEPSGRLGGRCLLVGADGCRIVYGSPSESTASSYHSRRGQLDV